MKLYLKLISIFICLLLFIVYYWYVNIRFHRVAIQDCTKNEVFYLEKKIEHPALCEVYLKGEIDGKAIINGDTIFGKSVDKLICKGDSYDEPFRVEYQNINVKIGELYIVYKFY
jgi:hypothetical protein